MEGDLLVYQQEEVHTIPTSVEELSVAGKLRIIERRNSALIEWRCGEDETNPDNDWAVINAAAVTFTHYNTTDSVEITTPRRHVRPISVELVDLRSYKLTATGSLVLIQRDGSTHPALQFPGKDAEYFVEVLQRYVSIKQSDKDPTLFLLQDKQVAEQDAKLAALNLVPSASALPRRRRQHPTRHHRPARTSPVDAAKPRPPGSSTSPDESPRNSAAVAMVPWANTPQRVIGFLNNFKRDPYTTTLSTLSKFYDNVLYYEWEDGIDPDRADDDNNPFNSFNGFDELEPGYQVVSLKGELAKRGVVQRLSPITQDDYNQYCDMDRRVVEQTLLKKRIFQGGIHPSLRSELWCCLLGYYDWSSSSAERILRRDQRQRDYDQLKAQWEAVSLDQESRFTGFRDRKSLIEKDVNRTDRSMPFYGGEDNPNVALLHNILMTYVMYNFDLGYVQGMSDLLAPILYVVQHESTAFWCFVGYLDMVHRNFDMDQSGMKEQLHGLQQIIAVVDPEFMGYLESKESANLYFCFRWLLVRFKRELSYMDTLRLWEVLWSGEPCPNFHLLVAAAILDHERNTIMENKFGFTEILKHINDTSQQLDLELTLSSAEAIYHQLASSPNVPPTILELLGLPTPAPSQDVAEIAAEVEPCSSAVIEAETTDGVTSDTATTNQRNKPAPPQKKEDFVLFRRSDCVDGFDTDDEDVATLIRREDVPAAQHNSTTAAATRQQNRHYTPYRATEESTTTNRACDTTSTTSSSSSSHRGLVGTVTNMLGSAVRQIAGDELSGDLFSPITTLQSVENIFEDAISHQFL